MSTLSSLVQRALIPIVAIATLVFSMNGTWMLASEANAAPTTAPTADGKAGDEVRVGRPAKKAVTGKLNLNTATEEQLLMLPSVGPAKAERIVTWRKRNGGFKRIADLRRVKGFGYKTFKRLQPYLDIKGETTLAPKH